MAAFPYLKSRVGSCVLVQRQLEKVRVAANEWELFGRVWFYGFLWPGGFFGRERQRWPLVVGLAVAISPLVKPGAGEFHPARQAQRADLGAGRKSLDKSITLSPVSWAIQSSAQLSPSCRFLCRTSSSTTSASTSVLFLSIELFGCLDFQRGNLISYPLPRTKTGSGAAGFQRLWFRSQRRLSATER